MQVATSLDLSQLIELGYEFCGTYDASGEILISCKPLTCVKKLKDYATKAKGMHGRDKALRALRYVVDNSASPRETLLAMLLCLPNALGGYGIKLPILNHKIDMNKRSAKAARKNYLVCDLYWSDAKLAVEYDSDEFHVGAERISEDSTRRMALAAKKITVISVTNRQLNNGGELNAVAHSVASQTGKRLRYKDPEFTHAHLALRESLQK